MEVLAELAVVNIKARFENEADLHAVAELFIAAHADAAAGGLAAHHAEVVRVLDAVDAVINVRIGQTHVDLAVDGDFGTLCDHGQGGQDTQGQECFFHFLSSSFWTVAAGSAPRGGAERFRI